MSQTGSSDRDSERRRKGAYAVGADTAGRRPAWLIPLLAGVAGESAVTVKAGDRISFRGGKVVATPTGYAAKVGVDTAEGATQLAAQKAHVEIAKNAIKLVS